MTMMPLFDRIIMRLCASPTTARKLALDLEADLSVIHALLRAMEEEGAVMRVKVRPGPASWHIAPGIGVGYRPEAWLNGPALMGPPTATTPCRAITVRGRPCHLMAAYGGLCVIHAALGADGPVNN
jgi:hypothetical protein